MASSDTTEPVFPGFLFSNEVLLKGEAGTKDLRVLHDTHNGTYTSRWQLTKEEIQAVVETGDIYVTILGAMHPALVIKAGIPTAADNGVVVAAPVIQDGQYRDVQELYRIADLVSPRDVALAKRANRVRRREDKESDASGEK